MKDFEGNRQGKSVMVKMQEDILLYGSSVVEVTANGYRRIPMQEVIRPVIIVPSEESAKVVKEMCTDITVIIQKRLPKMESL